MGRRSVIEPRDLLETLCWASAAARHEPDLERAAEALGVGPLDLDSAAGTAALDRCAGTVGLAVQWVELPVHDVGRDRPWIGLAPAGERTALLYVHGRRWGKHHVQRIEAGVVTNLRLTTRALARALGLATAASVARGLVPVVTLPLQPAVGETLSPWQRTRALFSLDRDDAWLCVVYGLAISVLSLGVPIAVQALVNTVSFGAILQPLLVLTALVAIVLGFSGLLRVLQAYVVEALQARMFVRSVADVARRIVRTDPAELQHMHPAELSHRVFELQTLQKGAAVMLFDGLDLVLRLGIGLPLLGFYHPWLLVFSLLLIGALAAVVFGVGRGALTTAIGESYAKHAAANWLEHLLRLGTRVRGRAMRQWAIERADRLARRYRDARARHFRHLVHHMLGGIGIQLVGSALLLGIGGALVISNQLTLGQLVAAELVFASIGMAVLKLHKQLEWAYDTMASADKLGLLLDLPLEREGGEHITWPEGPAAVRLRDVDLEIEGVPPLATGIALELSAGTRLALTGLGGTGKSTLLDVLATTRTPTSGSVEIDGIDTRMVELAGVRDTIALVREGGVIRGSVLANLRFHRRDRELPDVEAVVRSVGLADTIARLPDGLATELAPSGAPLSTSEVRRLLLARALIAEPRLLLIDGVLDDLGLEAEAHAGAIDAALGPAAPWTAIVVTSNGQVRRACDRAVQLVEGRLMEVSP
ncbi:MAG: ATP-binding cassette domain-containing protein [Kofleriaceae bacterium]|nr:ATP-binding cassette domain-containing protein [Kofleriaceae bacterium]